MVDVDEIDYIITKAISLKCGYTLKGIRESISPLINKVSDSPYENELLLEVIPRFVKEHYNNKIEHLLIIDNDGESYENDGDESRVRIPSKVDLLESVLFSMHNHPNASCLQSEADFNSIMEHNEKYAFCIFL